MLGGPLKPALTGCRTPIFGILKQMRSTWFPPLISLAAMIFANPAPGQLVRQANTTLTLPADLPSATGYTTQNALGNLTFPGGPMVVTSVPGETNRLFVAERNGTIQCVTNLETVDDGNTGTNPTKQSYLTLAPLLGPNESLRFDGENGFLSLAFHPDFRTVGRPGYGALFVFYSLQVNESGNARLFQRLARITVSNPAANNTTGLTVTHTPLITQRDEATNHNGADLAFGAEGYLYVSLGDEGGGGDQYNNSRFINKDFFGAMLRIDVDNKPDNLVPNPHNQSALTVSNPSAVNPGTYRVPADNPFVSVTTWHNAAINPATVRTEIWATGLRNPFRFSFDPPTGRLFLADVGQMAYEEINLITAGGDYGWSWREGFHSFTSGPSPTTPPATGFNPNDPIFEYDHTNDGVGNDSVIYGTSITGGVVYRGSRLTELYEAYLFADYGTGHLVALRQNPVSGLWSGTRLATDNSIVDFGTNPYDNETLFCDLGSLTVKRLARSGTSGTAPPSLLSQTGAFANLADLTVQPGIVPVTPNVNFWSDYAIKQRWFAIKNLTDTVGFNPDGIWSFPTGMVWIKHFDIETTRGNPATRRKLETRFLVKTAGGSYGLSYRWRADQTDADLVAESGSTELIAGSAPMQTWRFPSRTECIACHTPVGGHALSFNTPQLNRTVMYGAEAINQIKALGDAGYLDAPVSEPQTLPAFAAANDATQSIEWRVRSYLAVNCIQCHQPGGASPGLWDARSTTATDLANIIDGALINNAGDVANRFAVPGDTAHSMVLKRLRGDGAQRMPPLGTFERDLAAEQLLADWIDTALPDRQSFAQWQMARFGSSSTPESQPDADTDRDGRTNRFEFLTLSDPNRADSAWSFGHPVTDPSGRLRFEFVNPANRAAFVETTTDLSTWHPWPDPSNTPTYPAENTLRTIEFFPDPPSQFFRVRFTEP